MLLKDFDLAKFATGEDKDNAYVVFTMRVLDDEDDEEPYEVEFDADYEVFTEMRSLRDVYSVKVRAQKLSEEAEDARKCKDESALVRFFLVVGDCDGADEIELEPAGFNNDKSWFVFKTME